MQSILDSMELSTGFFQNKKEKASDKNYQKKEQPNRKTQRDTGKSDFSYLLRNLAKQQFSVTHLVVSLL